MKQNAGRHSEIGFKLLIGVKGKAFKRNLEGQKIPRKIREEFC